MNALEYSNNSAPVRPQHQRSDSHLPDPKRRKQAPSQDLHQVLFDRAQLVQTNVNLLLFFANAVQIEARVKEQAEARKRQAANAALAARRKNDTLPPPPAVLRAAPAPTGPFVPARTTFVKPPPMILLSVPPQPPLAQLAQLSPLTLLPSHPPGSVAMPPATSPKLPRPRKVQRTKTQDAPSDLLWERLPFREIHFSTQDEYVLELKKFASEHDPKFELRTGYTYTVDARVGNCTALHNSVAAGSLRLAFSVGNTLFFGNQCVKPNCKGDRQMKREQEQKKRGQSEDLEPDVSKEIVYSSSEDASAVIFNCTPSHKEGRPGAVRPLSLLLWESVQGQAFWALVYVKARRGRTTPGEKAKTTK